MSRILNWWLELSLRSTGGLGVSILVALMVWCAVFVHFEEGWSWVDAAYFTIVSTTTVGYGDLVPRNPATKIFLTFYLPVGIGVGFTVLASIGAKILEAQRRRLERRRGAMGGHVGHEEGGTP